MVRNLLENARRHGGDVACLGREGGGSRFVVALPLATVAGDFYCAAPASFHLPSTTCTITRERWSSPR